MKPTPVEYAAALPHRSNGAGFVWLHRYACFVALCTLLLIVAGGMVTSTGSGLSVPDWPTTYGENLFLFPPSKWVGGIFYEHGHRLIASTVGLLTIGLAVWIHAIDSRRWMRRLGWIALGMVIVQGILGGMTVRFNLPAWISIFHACLAQSFFCIIVSLAFFTSRVWKQGVADRIVIQSAAVRHAAIVFFAAIFFQLFLGALMRHTHAGLAVPDFPLAYGQLIPALSDADVEFYNQDRAFSHFLPEVSRTQILTHMLHRGGAVLVCLTAGISWICSRQAPAIAALRRPLQFATLLILVQIGLGAWTVLSCRLPAIATLHVATGAMLLGTACVLVLGVFGFLRNTARSAETINSAPKLGGAAA